MSESPKGLVVLMTRSADHELSSVAFTIANGGITAGFKVYAFLTDADTSAETLLGATHMYTARSIFTRLRAIAHSAGPLRGTEAQARHCRILR
jgi:hypothetical protein